MELISFELYDCNLVVYFFSCAKTCRSNYRTSSRIAVDPFLVWLGTPLIGSEALLHNKIEEPRQAESKIVKQQVFSHVLFYNVLHMFNSVYMFIPLFLYNLEQHHFDL